MTKLDKECTHDIPIFQEVGQFMGEGSSKLIFFIKLKGGKKKIKNYKILILTWKMEKFDTKNFQEKPFTIEKVLSWNLQEGLNRQTIYPGYII